MDGNTESLIAVIGSPIAGNPAQFVLERALEALDVDCRVLSFEVPADRLGSALDGIESLRFHGALVDHAMAELTGQWLAHRQRPTPPAIPAPQDATFPQNTITSRSTTLVDCLYRPLGPPVPPAHRPLNTDQLVGADLRGDWLRNAVLRHFTSRGREPKRGLRLGTLPCRWADLGLVASSGGPDATLHANFRVATCDATPAAEQLDDVDVIAMTGNPGGPAKLDLADWPTNDASTLVLDLTPDGHPDLDSIERHGYHVLTWEEGRINTLAEALRRWTGREPDPELIRDAIEEYLAV